jgi:hypothetical protein
LIPLPEEFSLNCFICGKDIDSNLLKDFPLLCSDPNCVKNNWPKVEHSKLVSAILQPSNYHSSIRKIFESLPRLDGDKKTDLFALWADGQKDFPNSNYYKSSESGADYLPFNQEILKNKFNLHCGNAICYRSKRLQSWLDQPNLFVLDFGTYRWSGTLKDPRTWAILNLALQKNIKHLAAWTAGNAGYALGALTKVCNQFLDAKDRISVYALYDRQDDNIVESNIEKMLKFVECDLIKVPSIEKSILPPGKIFNKVKDKAFGFNNMFNHESYWDVTDGWELVGMYIYRLLMMQVIRDLQPTHIVAPLGTGNLIMGIILAVRDYKELKADKFEEIKIISTIPLKTNIIRQIKIRKGFSDTEITENISIPLMPKIASTYSPLIGCIDYSLNKKELEFVEVNSKEQYDAAKHLLETAKGRKIYAEPSSLSAFAGLPKTVHQFCKQENNERILVINSGFGIMSETESDFLLKFIKG